MISPDCERSYELLATISYPKSVTPKILINLSSFVVQLIASLLLKYTYSNNSRTLLVGETMPKLPNLIAALSAALISFMADSAFSSPLKYPVIQNPDSYIPFCYIQTAEGQTLDLSNMCGFASPNVCFDATNKSDLATILKEFCKKNERCSLTSTCREIPQTFNRPNTDSPL